jgi:hypothetical protein
MKRRVSTILAVASLLLCLATVHLWARSYQRQGWIKWTHCGSSRCYATSLGNFPGRLSLGMSWEPAKVDAVATEDPLPRMWTSKDVWRPVPLSAQQGWQTWSDETFVATGRYNPYDATLPERPDLHQLAGVAWYLVDANPGGGSLLVPHRYVALLLAMLPLRWIWVTCRNRRRARRHACVACGYDLSATPQRCPECGATVKSPNAANAIVGDAA